MNWSFPSIDGLFVSIGTVALLTVGLGCGPQEVDPPPKFKFYESDTDSNPTPDTGPDTDTGIDTSDAPAGEPTGAKCTDRSDCVGDTCFTGDEYPGGYCSRTGCRQGSCSGADGLCIQFEDGRSTCYAGCAGDSDCRQGYTCQRSGSQGRKVCRPGDPEGPPPFSATRKALGVTCQPSQVGRDDGNLIYEFSFELGANTQSFAMVPYVNSGVLRPRTLTTPNETVDLRRDYRHHNSRLTELRGNGDLSGFGTYGEVAFDWPIIVPYAPQYSQYAVPGGKYQVTVEADQDKPCLYVLEKRTGTKLDLNFYFVGANGLSPRSAKTDPDFQEAINWMERIYRKVGVQIGTTRYFELSDTIEQRYQVLNDRDEAVKLMAYGEPPSKTLPGHLSVDVFLVDSLNFERRGREVNVLGMSAGIPGAAGMHGNARDGLVFQTVDLGMDNKHVGLIMAHEIGHFLGLRHTTELVHGTSQGQRVDRLLGSTDPITDTPVCSNIREKLRNDPTSCGDWENLMFPVAPPSDSDQDARLTTRQGKAMKANPLITIR